MPEAGCDGCYRGLVRTKFEAACCCDKPRAERCSGCIDRPRSMHVCLVETAAEVDHALYMLTGAPVAKITRTKATRALTGPLEHGNGERMPRSKD
jgi:hypothetical protein